MNKQPGYCPVSMNEKIEFRRFKQIKQFVGNPLSACYIGEPGLFNLKVDTFITAKDFNFDRLLGGRYEAVYCFEVLEHLQNPLWFMKQLQGLKSSVGAIYLSTPHRPKMFWSQYHYNEISAAHMQKWLLNPLGLRIVRKKKLYINKGWTDYLIGFRPVCRAIRTWNFKPIVGSLTNTTWIYEIR